MGHRDLMVPASRRGASLAGDRWIGSRHNARSAIDRTQERPDAGFTTEHPLHHERRHAAHAISAYGSVVNETRTSTASPPRGPASTASSAATRDLRPSRATILAGTHSHVNGVRTLADRFDGSQVTFRSCSRGRLPDRDFGKWTSVTVARPTRPAFDNWSICLARALSRSTLLRRREDREYEGYAPTDHDFFARLAGASRPERPVHADDAPQGAAPPVEPDEKHATMYDDVEMPEPRPSTTTTPPAGRRGRTMRIGRDMTYTASRPSRPPG